MERKEKTCVLNYFDVTRSGVEEKKKEFKIYFISNRTMKLYVDWSMDLQEVGERNGEEKISRKDMRSLNLIDRRNQIALSILEDNGQKDIDMDFLDRKCTAEGINMFIISAVSKDADTVEKKTVEG